MEDQLLISTDFLTIRRIMALIAYANNEIDEEERTFLASTIGNNYQLNEQQLELMIADTQNLPSINEIVKTIVQPEFKRVLITELSCLALAKSEWDIHEKEKAIEVIEAMNITKKAKGNIIKLFNLIIETRQLLDFSD